MTPKHANGAKKQSVTSVLVAIDRIMSRLTSREPFAMIKTLPPSALRSLASPSRRASDERL